MSCSDIFKREDGSPANVICLTDENFDKNGNLKDFDELSGIILFYAPWCGHCKDMKPIYIQMADKLKGFNVRAFAVNGDKSKDLLRRINPEVWGYLVRGFPTIVGYHKGKFYSEYGMDPNNRQVFRTLDDLVEYGKSLGTGEIYWN
jgi:thiol-disulfide isomerase/thioredoxin